MFNTILWWQLIIMFIVFVAGIYFLISFIIKKGVSVKAKGIEIGKNIVDIVNPDKDTHANCPRWRDILLVVEWSTIATREISYLEDIQLIRDQMNFAEERICDIRDLFRRRYLKLLAEKAGSKIGIMQTNESHAYQNILTIITTTLEDEFRFIFRENHLIERADFEFESYIKLKKDHINNKVTELLNEIYPPGANPSREEVYDANEDIKSSVYEIIEDIIRRGKFIAIECDNKKKDILRNLDDKVKKIVGDFDGGLLNEKSS